MKRQMTPDKCCRHGAMAAGFAALSHPVRIEIIRHLAGLDHTCCCKDVVGHVRLAQSTVSQHLKVLVEAGLLHRQSERQTSRFAVDFEALSALSGKLADLVEACAAANTLQAGMREAASND